MSKSVITSKVENQGLRLMRNPCMYPSVPVGTGRFQVRSLTDRAIVFECFAGFGRV